MTISDINDNRPVWTDPTPGPITLHEVIDYMAIFITYEVMSSPPSLSPPHCHLLPLYLMLPPSTYPSSSPSLLIFFPLPLLSLHSSCILLRPPLLLFLLFPPHLPSFNYPAVQSRPIGTDVFVVTATDADTGTNGDVFYSLPPAVRLL